MFRQNLLHSLFMIMLIGTLVHQARADSAPSGVSIGSLTEVVNRDGVGDQVIGYGVVTGLQGTGDDLSKSPTLARSYVTLLQNLGVPGLNELAISRTESFAVVMVTGDVPFTAGLGDQIDLTVSSALNASSLEGGQLHAKILTPAGFTEDLSPIAVSSMNAVVPDSLSNPLRVMLSEAGRITRIPRLRQQDIFIRSPYGDSGVCFEMRLGKPWSSSGMLAGLIADSINEIDDIEYDPPLATLREDGRILVRFPDYADSVDRRIRFLGKVERTRIEERLVGLNTNTVLLDRTRGLVVVGADVRFRPTVVSVEGLEHVTIQPAPEPTQFDPLIRTDSTVGLATRPGAVAGARLQDLVNQMRQLQVPVDKQIDLIEALKRSGSLLNVDIWELRQ